MSILRKHTAVRNNNREVS